MNVRLDFVSERSLAYWDVSSMDIAVLVCAEPTQGMRVRGGLREDTFQLEF